MATKKSPRARRTVVNVPPAGATEARQRIANLYSTAQSLMALLPQRLQRPGEFDALRREFVGAYSTAERIARGHGIAMPGDLRTLYANAVGNFGGMFGGRAVRQDAEYELEMMLVRAGL